jgi:OmpA-OmpF porin, OOP family
LNNARRTAWGIRLSALAGFHRDKEDFAMKRSVWFLAAILAAFLLMSSLAAAEEGINLQLFRPSVFGGNFISFDDSHTLSTLGFGAGLLVSYGNSPFVYYNDDGDVEFDFINDLYTAHVYAGFGTFRWASLGVEAPVHMNVHKRQVEDIATVEGVEPMESETVMGDVLAKLKLRALYQEKHWIGIALTPYATFPTGDVDAFLGEGVITYGGNLTLEHDFSVFNIGLIGGYLVREPSDLLETEVGDAIRYGGGLSREFDFGLSFSLEAVGHYFDVEDTEKYQGAPLEGLATLRYKFGANGPRLIAGAGPGLSTSVGTPAYRVVGGMDYFYARDETPKEGDLTVRTIDADGSPIAASVTIEGASSKNLETDTNGQWEGVVKSGDYHVEASKSGYEDGSAEAALERGGAAVVTVTLTKIPEPDPTILKIAVVEKKTKKKIKSTLVFDKDSDAEKTYSSDAGEFTFKWDAGTFKITASAPGYETKVVDTTVSANQTTDLVIELRKKITAIGKVFFAYSSDRILHKSYPVLDNIVEQVQAMDDVKKLVIEGHCSSEGGEAHNKSLSKRRAMSVKNFLIKKGLKGIEMEIVAYGESRPIASNDNEAGRAQNRRVEFIIEK